MGKNVPLYLAEHGALEKEWLAGATAGQVADTHHHRTPAQEEATLINALDEEPLSGGNCARAENASEGFRSVGWRIAPQIVFDYQQVFAFLSGLKVERMKAIFITTEGIVGYNLNSDTPTEMILDDCQESRIEIIAQSIQSDWENQYSPVAPIKNLSWLI